MKAIFISDAHLRKSGDERYKKLMSFFDKIKEGKIGAPIDPQNMNLRNALIDDLFIAGDLFDFWFCPKEKINPEFKLAIDKLVELQQAGIRIHLSEGNHDFFMKEYFCDVLGMDVFEEMTDVRMDNLKVLIAHGDTADSANKRYLLFRKILRSNIFYNIQRLIPASIRWTIAGFTSTASKELTVEDGDALVKKMSLFALTKFQKGYDAVILGHCHVPSINYFTVNDQTKVFVTLGDWIRHCSFLYYENNKFSLQYYERILNG